MSRYRTFVMIEKNGYNVHLDDECAPREICTPLTGQAGYTCTFGGFQFYAKY
jgi:hypothetical protein